MGVVSGIGVTSKGQHEQALCDEGIVLYLDCSGGNTNLCMC